IQGSVYAFHDTAGVGSFLNFGSLSITSLGLLSASLPTSGFFNNYFASSALNITVTNSLSNAGTISSPGLLAISAGGAINNFGLMSAQSINLSAAQAISNTGSIAATMGAANLNSATGQYANSGLISALSNINLASQQAASLANISFDNTRGVLQASQAINFRDPAFMEKADLDITGGDLYSSAVNLIGGRGTVTFDAEDVTGSINATGHNVTIHADTKNLQLGNLIGTGDPRVSNTGSVNITANIIGNPISIYAGQNITDSGGAKTIDSQGGDLFLAAGVTFTPNAGDETITIGSSATGGRILLNDNNLTVTTSGGNLLAIAHEGSIATSGRVQITPGAAITTNGGNVTVIAEENSTGVDGITIGTINTNGPIAGAGDIFLRTALITQSENIIVSNTGAILNPAGLTAIGSGFSRLSGVRATGDLLGNGASVDIFVAGRIQIEGILDVSVKTLPASILTTPVVSLVSSGSSVRIDNDAGAALAINTSNPFGIGGSLGIETSGGGTASSVRIDGGIDNSAALLGGSVTLRSATSRVDVNGPGAA
ncbi:MAG: hypothetical protein K8F91_09230, partial [Candidatus Obscuribacterales bacterium]|nr:hypothetical protein [Candidatus Obscuribacterales bacterium]